MSLVHASARAWLFCGTGEADADAAFDAPGNFNPIVPGYFADPTIERFGDTFYLYATTDGNGGDSSFVTFSGFCLTTRKQ